MHAYRLADRDALAVSDQAADLVRANPDPDGSPDPRAIDLGSVRCAVRRADPDTRVHEPLRSPRGILDFDLTFGYS